MSFDLLLANVNAQVDAIEQRWPVGANDPKKASNDLRLLREIFKAFTAEVAAINTDRFNLGTMINMQMLSGRIIKLDQDLWSKTPEGMPVARLQEMMQIRL